MKNPIYNRVQLLGGITVNGRPSRKGFSLTVIKGSDIPSVESCKEGQYSITTSASSGWLVGFFIRITSRLLGCPTAASNGTRNGPVVIVYFLF